MNLLRYSPSQTLRVPLSFEPSRKTNSLYAIAKQLLQFPGMRFGDKLFLFLARLAGLSVIVLLGLILAYLVYASLPAIQKFGTAFLYTSTWDPVRDVFGALPVIYGTLVTSFLALLIAGPIGVGIALFLNELAPKKVAMISGFLIEMLAAIPSVVFGLWGIFVLAPWLRESIQPWFIDHFGMVSLFAGPAYGVGKFTAGLILAVMILPTISSISKEVFRTIPAHQREAALALGATQWETMKLSVLKASKNGIIGALFLGLGRALGETMAVTMVIGNRAQIMPSLFSPAQTMASVVANEYAEATSDIHLAALAEVGLVLFGVTFLINFTARVLIHRISKARKA